jgi:hypothetical protein
MKQRFNSNHTRAVVIAMLSQSTYAAATNNYSHHDSLVTRETPESLALGGISLVRMGNGISDSAAATPLQKNALQLHTGLPKETQVTSQEKVSALGFGLQFSLLVPNPFMSVGTGLKVRHDQKGSRFEPTVLNALEYQNKETEVRGALGALVFDELSIGLEPIFVFGDEVVTRASPWQKIESSSYYGTTGRVSAQLNLGDFRFGASWQKELVPTVDRSIVPQEGSELGTPYFPGETRIGAGFSFPAFGTSLMPLQINLLTEANFLSYNTAKDKLVRATSRVYQRGYAYYVPFTETATERVQELDTETKMSSRLALEGLVMETPNTSLLAQAAFSTLPSLQKNAPEETHYSAGVTLLLWGFRISASTDWTAKEQTYALGLGAQYATK